MVGSFRSRAALFFIPFNIDRGAYQVLSLIAPFVRGDDRVLLERLGRDYLA